MATTPGRRPTYPDPAALSADALRSRMRRARKKIESGKAEPELLVWYDEACAYRDRRQPGRADPGDPAPADGVATSPDPPASGATPTPEQSNGSPVEPETGPAVESAFADSGLADDGARFSPRDVYGDGASGPQPPPASGQADAGQHGGAQGRRPPRTERDEQIARWREDAGLKVGVALCSLHHRMAARGWPSIPEPEQVFFMIPWAVTDWLYERYPDDPTFSQKDMRNAVLASAVGSTASCALIGAVQDYRRKKKAADARRSANQPIDRRDEPADADRVEPEPEPEFEPEPEPESEPERQRADAGVPEGIVLA